MRALRRRRHPGGGAKGCAGEYAGGSAGPGSVGLSGGLPEPLYRHHPLLSRRPAAAGGPGGGRDGPGRAEQQDRGAYPQDHRNPSARRPVPLCVRAGGRTPFEAGPCSRRARAGGAGPAPVGHRLCGRQRDGYAVCPGGGDAGRRSALGIPLPVGAGGDGRGADAGQPGGTADAVIGGGVISSGRPPERWQSPLHPVSQS